MKTTSQARVKGSKSAVVSQSQSPQPAAGPGAKGRPQLPEEKGWWNTNPKDWTDKEREDYMRMRSLKMSNPVDLDTPGIYQNALSDAEALDFISQVMFDNEPAFKQLAHQTLTSKKFSKYWAVHISEAIVAARAVARRVRWEGLKSTPTFDDERQGKRRTPLLLDLPGMSGMAPFSDTQLLEHICTALHYFRLEIGHSIKPKLAGSKECELIEALAIAELVEDRNSGVDELEIALASGKRTALQNDVWLFKTAQAAIR